MKEFFAELSKLLRDLMPAIASFFLGKRVGEIGKAKLESTRDALKLELERVKNAQEVENDNRNKPDSDIIDDAIRAGLHKVPKSD